MDVKLAAQNSFREIVLNKVWQRWHSIANGIDFKQAYYRPVEERLLLSALNLGYEQVYSQLHLHSPDWPQFLAWATTTAGQLEALNLSRIEHHLQGGAVPANLQTWYQQLQQAPDVLSAEDLAQWQRDGYVIVRQAISAEHAADCAELIWREIAGNPIDERSWYSPQARKFMLSVYQHELLDQNRHNPRIHKAFAQLWGRLDLWPSYDRLGFNPPEKFGHSYSSSGLHWDVSLTQPLPFSTQGLIYLTDTAPDQGALCLVPGFHHRLAPWLQQLPKEADPRQQDLHALGATYIGANAGDMIIWQQALPHAASPNRSDKPRLVHYLNLQAIDLIEHSEWR